MGLGRAHLGGWTIRSRGRLHPICCARVIRSRRYRVGDGCHPTSDRRIGRETWSAESRGGYCYGDNRLTLNPSLVFLSVAFWAWMWGAMGALLAVPLLISVVVANKHLSSYFAVRAS